jgi:alkylhydroperoxidase family enzyme
MKPMFLADVEAKPLMEHFAKAAEELKAHGAPVPQIWHLFSLKPEINEHLARFTQGVMRGPSPLEPGTRELIAAFTSKRNDCPF